jgi:peptidoglycan/LPS O-acetylase OafA/YrhL
MIQWTLAIELRGSFLVYLALCVTAGFTPQARIAAFTFLTAYAIYGGDLLGEIPFFTGTLLADLALVLSSSHDTVSTAEPFLGRYHKYWPTSTAVFALIVASYPTNSPELAAWSRVMIRFGERVFHPDCMHLLIQANSGEHRWAFSLIGAILLIYAIHYSPALRKIFSWRYAVFFGSISFPVYLIHSFVMRSLLVWVVYGMIPESPVVVRYTLNWIAFLAYFALIIYLSVEWNRVIDSRCGKFTAWLEDIMVGKKSVLGTLLAMQERGVLPQSAIHINGHTKSSSLEDGYVKEKPPESVA